MIAAQPVGQGVGGAALHTVGVGVGLVDDILLGLALQEVG